MNKSLENIKAKMSRSLSLNISISENQTRSVRKPLLCSEIINNQIKTKINDCKLQ